MLEGKRLLYDVGDAQAFGFRDLGGGRAPGNDNNWKCLMCLPYPLKDVEAAQARHHQVEEHGIGDKSFQNLKRLLSVMGNGCFVPLNAYRFRNDFSDFWLVVHDQDLHQSPIRGRLERLPVLLISIIITWSQTFKSRPFPRISTTSIKS